MKSNMRHSRWSGGCSASFAIVCAVLGMALAVAAPANADDAAASAAAPTKEFSLFSPQEVAVRFSFGPSSSRSLNFYTFGPRVAYDLLPSWIPPMFDNRWRLAIEMTGSIIHGTDHDHDGEFAFTPLLFDWRYDTGSFFVPYFEGGEGIVLTTLNRLRIGGPFEFSSSIGAGAHLFFAHEDAVTLGFRLRHISNARLKKDNVGLNTYFFTIGLSTFPGRP